LESPSQLLSKSADVRKVHRGCAYQMDASARCRVRAYAMAVAEAKLSVAPSPTYFSRSRRISPLFPEGNTWTVGVRGWEKFYALSLQGDADFLDCIVRDTFSRAFNSSDHLPAHFCTLRQFILTEA
jgi:hypothetical protein